MSKDDPKVGGFKTVGRTPDQNLAWLLRFIQDDELAALTGDALADAIDIFCKFCIRQGARAGELSKAGTDDLDARRLNRLTGDLLRGIERLKTGEEWRLPIARDLVQVVHWDRSRDHPAQYRFKARLLETTGFWLAQQLIGWHIHQIERCQRKGCEKFFIVRKQGRFCSPQCAQRVRTARFIGRLKKRRPAKLKELRQVNYLRRLLRTNHPGAAKVYLANVERKDPKRAKRLREQVEKSRGGK